MSFANAIIRSSPHCLSPQERARLEAYRRMERYYRAGMDARGTNSLYGSEIPGQPSLAEFKNLPDFMTSVFNLIPKIVNTDRSALMNNLKPEGIRIEGDQRGTELLRAILQENSFLLLLSKFFETGISKGDAYLKVMRDSRKPHGIRLVVLAPETVFPILDPHDCEEVLAYKIMYSYQALEESPFKSLLVDGAMHEYLEVITPQEVSVYIDHRLQEERSFELEIEGLPIFHAANLPVAGDFFGLPTPYDVYDDIDDINLLLSYELERFKIYAYPQIIAKGITKHNGLKWGRKKIHFLPPEGDMSLLEWRGDPQILNTIKAMVEGVKDKKPQFAIDKLRESGVNHSGEAIKNRLLLFVAHIHLLEASYSEALKQAFGYILRLLKHQPEGEMVIDFGPPLPAYELDLTKKAGIEIS